MEKSPSFVPYMPTEIVCQGMYLVYKDGLNGLLCVCFNFYLRQTQN